LYSDGFYTVRRFLRTLVSTHEEADAWLEKNRGLTLGAVTGSSLGRTKISDAESGLVIKNEPDNRSGVLIERLPADLSETLLGDLPFKEVKPVHDLMRLPGMSEQRRRLPNPRPGRKTAPAD
jgi:hypothetical protein